MSKLLIKQIENKINLYDFEIGCIDDKISNLKSLKKKLELERNQYTNQLKMLDKSWEKLILANDEISMFKNLIINIECSRKNSKNCSELYENIIIYFVNDQKFSIEYIDGFHDGGCGEYLINDYELDDDDDSYRKIINSMEDIISIINEGLMPDYSNLQDFFDLIRAIINNYCEYMDADEIINRLNLI